MKLFILLSLFILSFSYGSDVLIITEQNLAQDSRVQEKLQRYINDMETARNITVSTETYSSPKDGGTAEGLKQILINNKTGLQGAIFLGDLPRALFEFHKWVYEEESAALVFNYQRWTSDFFFMDLDGIWQDTASGWFHAFDGKIKETTVESPNFDYGSGSPIPNEVPADSFSIRFTGFIKSPKTGLCSLKVVSDNGRRVKIGDRVIIDAWFGDWDIPYTGAMTMEKDHLYDFLMEYFEEIGGAYSKLYWKWEDSDWELIPNNVWFHNSPLQAGLSATYFGNMSLTETVDYPNAPSGWISGISNGVYDGHYSPKGSVSDSMEIWISRIDPNTAGYFGNPKDLLLNWFDKVHDSYMLGKSSQKAQLFIKDIANISNASNHKFVDGLTKLYGQNFDIFDESSIGYLEGISRDYDWTTYVGHGSPTSLDFENSSVKDIEYPMVVGPRIFHFASCSPLLSYDLNNGNTQSVSVGSAHLFGTRKGGLASVGATKTSGGDQLDTLMYTALSQGASIGEAFKYWVNERIKRNNEGIDIYDWFYVESLIGDPMQTLAQPAIKGKSNTIIISDNDIEVQTGIEQQYSCSRPRQKLYQFNNNGSLIFQADVNFAGTYKVAVLARSTNNEFTNNILFGEGSLTIGELTTTADLQSSIITGTNIQLTSGIHTFTLKAPEGVQIAGIALITDDVSASNIQWPTNINDPQQKIKAFVRYEGFENAAMLRPRLKLTNVSDESINGFIVRYYFSGENPATAEAHTFFPQNDAAISIHSENNSTGYVEWDFSNLTITAGETPFYGNGPFFEIHNSNWDNWNPLDDPSYVPNATNEFVENNNIVILDKNNNLIGGSCIESVNEAPNNPAIRIFAMDSRAANPMENQASEIHLNIENIGNTPISNFDIRYYFFIEDNFTPVLNAYSYILPQGCTAELTSLGNGRWQVNIHCNNTLISGESLPQEIYFMLNLQNWEQNWNPNNDPSHIGLTNSYTEAMGICVYDANENKLFGNTPKWPTAPVFAKGNIFSPNNSGYKTVIVDEGIILGSNKNSYVSLSLVNANGHPIKELFSNTIRPGEQLIYVNWENTNKNNTYLVLKENGTIKSVKQLSKL